MTNICRIDTNDYEFNKEAQYGCYIIHGFSSTTYEVKELAEFLGNKGYHTIAKNLPGHGTTVEECNCSINQLPIILKNDTISKLIRLTPALSTSCTKGRFCRFAIF